MQLKYFTESDFACRCGCGLLPKPETMLFADRVREEWGQPLNSNSGARCHQQTINLRMRGIPAALGSAHNEGLAVDLAPVAARPELPEDYLKRVKAFQAFCLSKLEEWGCWMEHPGSTPLWAHLDFRPRKDRVFKPQ